MSIRLEAIDPAVAKSHHPIGRFSDCAVVSNQDNRGPLLSVQVMDDLENSNSGLEIEVSGGLVTEEHRRAIGEGASDRDALLLAA